MIAKLEHVLGLQYLLKLQRVKQKLIKNQNLGYALINLSGSIQVIEQPYSMWCHRYLQEVDGGSGYVDVGIAGS